MKENNKYIVLSPNDKPIKVVIENNTKTKSNGNIIEVYKKLSSLEVEQLFNNIYGTTELGVLDCSNISDEEFKEIERLLQDQSYRGLFR